MNPIQMADFLTADFTDDTDHPEAKVGRWEGEKVGSSTSHLFTFPLSHFQSGRLALALAVALVVPASPAFAHDLIPPCWRGQAGTTFQEWRFPTADEQSPPDLSTNAYGVAQATVAPNYDGGAEGWRFQFPLCGLGCAQSNYWDMGPAGVMTLTVPNAPGSSPTAHRLVWLQVAQFISAVFDNAYATVSIPNAVLLGAQTNIVETISGGTGSWVVHQTMWRLPASPASQTISITTGPSGGVIDGIVVDTRYVDPAAIAPGGGLNVAIQSECESVTVGPASTYTWEMRDASGGAGVGFDQLNVGTGDIDIQANSASNCTINLISLNGASAGPAANFNNNNPAAWPIASAAGGSVLNFDASKFNLSHTTNQFQNDLQGGVFSVATNGGDLQVRFTPNHAPTAGNAAFNRGPGMPVRIRIPDLLSAHTADSDGDGRTFVSVGASTNGSTITTDGTFIFYTPANDSGESFPYVIKDNRTYRAGDTVRTGQGLIQITVNPTVGSVLGIAFSSGSVTARFAGIPGYIYVIQRSPDLSAGSWSDLLTTNAPPNGLFEYLDTSPLDPTGFYRTRSQ